MTTTELVAALTGALCGGLAVPRLTGRGLRQLRTPELNTRALWTLGAGVGAVVGATTALAAMRSGNGTLAVPLVAWGAALVAVSCCDAVSQRIPTALVRQSIVLVSLLLTSALMLHEDWSGLVSSIVAAGVCGLVLLLCWRVAGAGFGDVRLAVLGGLGLGHATHRGLLVGLVMLALAVLLQATLTLRKGGNLKTPVPFGPALSVGFVMAAVS